MGRKSAEQLAASFYLDVLLVNVQAVADPVERINHINALIAQGARLHADLAAIKRDAVRQMRADGMSLTDIGKALGVTKARASQLADG